jgi:hypothetical protein
MLLEALEVGLHQVLVVQAAQALLDKVIMAAVKIILVAVAAVVKVLLALLVSTQQVAQVAQGLFRLSLVCQSNMLAVVVAGTKQVAQSLVEVWVPQAVETVVVMLQVLALCGQLLVLLTLVEVVAVQAVAVLAAPILLLLVQLAVQA